MRLLMTFFIVGVMLGIALLLVLLWSLLWGLFGYATFATLGTIFVIICAWYLAGSFLNDAR